MGENLVIETTGIAVVAWLNDQNRYAAQITPAVNWLVAQVKAGGRYGSTQATILALKAITSYMQNFANLNGDGTFALRINGQVVQSISFTPKSKEAIEFDFASIMTNSKFSGFFKPGRKLNISISLDNFKPAPGETRDFRVNYAFSFNYYDQTPESSSNSVLGFTIKPSFRLTDLG